MSEVLTKQECRVEKRETCNVATKKKCIKTFVCKDKDCSNKDQGTFCAWNSDSKTCHKSHMNCNRNNDGDSSKTKYCADTCDKGFHIMPPDIDNKYGNIGSSNVNKWCMSDVGEH